MTIEHALMKTLSKFLKASLVLSRVALMALITFGAASSWALLCASGSEDAESVASRLGGADLVFVGKIEQLGAIKIRRWRAESVRATVSVERVFKGEAKKSVVLYVDSRMTVGQRVIF
jgi:hypothetical protein